MIARARLVLFLAVAAGLALMPALFAPLAPWVERQLDADAGPAS